MMPWLWQEDDGDFRARLASAMCAEGRKEEEGGAGACKEEDEPWDMYMQPKEEMEEVKEEIEEEWGVKEEDNEMEEGFQPWDEQEPWGKDCEEPWKEGAEDEGHEWDAKQWWEEPQEKGRNPTEKEEWGHPQKVGWDQSQKWFETGKGGSRWGSHRYRAEYRMWSAKGGSKSKTKCKLKAPWAWSQKEMSNWYGKKSNAGRTDAFGGSYNMGGYQDHEGQQWECLSRFRIW